MVGVSYYTLSSMSYLIDIARGRHPCERNAIDLAFWLSFFPKFIAGPIERYASFKGQIGRIRQESFQLENVKRGLLIAAYGYFQKMVIADRLGIVVDHVYGTLGAFEGITLFAAMICYSLQIYFDFAGYSAISLGISHALGIKICKNFNSPYFSISVTEFWRRWHISLSSWLRDYVYIPLGGNRKGAFRKKVNIAVTFLVSGIWHGAGWHYVVWGGLHALFQICEQTIPVKFQERFGRGFRRAVTFLLVSFAWIFFRAPSLKDACAFAWKMAGRFNPWCITDGTFLGLGLDGWDWFVAIAAILVAGLIEKEQQQNKGLYERLQKRNIIFRWAAYYLIIVFLIVFGVYGANFDMSNFIYFKY